MLYVLCEMTLINVQHHAEKVAPFVLGLGRRTTVAQPWEQVKTMQVLGLGRRNDRRPALGVGYDNARDNARALLGTKGPPSS